jgi:hypothetical protein
MQKLNRSSVINIGIQGFLSTCLVLLVTSSVSASTCESKLKEPTQIELAMLKSSDPLVRFVAQPSEAAAAQVLAQPASLLMDEPILARIAFATLCEPSAEQAGRFRSSINGLAFSHLVQISASSSPDVIDELIRRTQYGSNWDEGFSAMVRRLERGIAGVPVELLVANGWGGDAASFQKFNSAQREVALENSRWIAAFAYAAGYGLPRFEFFTRACKDEQLEVTAERRALCTSVGQGLESQSSTLISVLIGAAIQKNLATNDDDMRAVDARRNGWRALHSSLAPVKLPVDASIETRIAALAAENANSRRLIEMGEVNASLAIYAETDNADPKVLALLWAARQ